MPETDNNTNVRERGPHNSVTPEMNIAMQSMDMGGGGRGPGACAKCARQARGEGCEGCEEAMVDTKELEFVLDVNRRWIARAKARGIFRECTAGRVCSYVYRSVREGVLKYYGARWLARLAAAEVRLQKILSGRAARRRNGEQKTTGRKRKGKK
jgi:hypothetical protein